MCPREGSKSGSPRRVFGEDSSHCSRLKAKPKYRLEKTVQPPSSPEQHAVIVLPRLQGVYVSGRVLLADCHDPEEDIDPRLPTTSPTEREETENFIKRDLKRSYLSPKGPRLGLALGIPKKEITLELP